MKLQKLVISGFGPYALRQELDFENSLKDKNMFVITGNTGAGKTTIFDAINFALYGEASGSERDGKSLRSDFADPNTATEVELWFSLRGKDYYIKRSPSYMRPKQRGEGLVESKATAEIKLSKDKTLTGASDVTKEVEKILGITSEQFKQLVMIPQGEFKRLLLAKNEEKEDIFRKIFGTEVFENVQKQIKKQAGDLEINIKGIMRDRLNRIRSFNCREKDEELFRLINAEKPNIELIMNSFYEFIREDKEELKNIEANINKVEGSIKKLSTDRDLGVEIIKKFDKVEINKKELDALNSHHGEFDIKKELVNKGKKTLNVKVYEDRYEDKNTQLKDLSSKLVDIERVLAIFKNSYEVADKAFKAQQGREDEKNKLMKEKDEAERLKEKVSQYENSEKEVKTLAKRVEEIKTKLNEIELTIEKNENRLKEINCELEHINKAKDEKGKLEIEQLDYKNRGEKLNRLKNAIKKWEVENTKHQREHKAYIEMDNTYKAVKSHYEAMEDILRRSQAGILAAGLEEGTSCPVCGSTHHPHLAKVENSDVSEEGVKECNTEMETARTTRDDKYNEIIRINAALTSIKKDFIDPLVKELLSKEDIEEVMSISNEVDQLIQTNGSHLSNCESRIKELNKLVNTEKDKINERDGLTGCNADLRKKLQLKNAEHIEESKNLSAAQTTLDNIKSEFKGEVANLKKLEDLIKSINIKLGEIRKDYEDAEKTFNHTKEIYDKETGNHKATSELKAKTEVELGEAYKIFNEKLVEFGFKDTAEYRKYSLTQKVINNIEGEINSFNGKLEGAKRLYEASLKEISGLSIVNITEIAEKLKRETGVKTELLEKKMNIFSRISSNSNVYDDCIRYNKKIEGDEKEYETIGKLSNIINGDNSKKVNFERYVLASYFEDIIEAANYRFSKMTSGRFELLRKQDMGDKRKGQGLDLEVFDNYTGKARDVKTLSGGESFKASLAMALGLADVVQAHAGGIQLDTMFIDEGFGTLDPESLDSAVECLMDLQNDGRLVGVISHVAELKERIPARLEVSSTNKGSMAIFRV